MEDIGGKLDRIQNAVSEFNMCGLKIPIRKASQRTMQPRREQLTLIAKLLLDFSCIHGANDGRFGQSNAHLQGVAGSDVGECAGKMYDGRDGQ